VGILYDKVTELEAERKQVQQRLEFFNVPSPGRDKLLQRSYEIGNEITYLRNRTEMEQNMQ
jgi:hypothetical protein